MNQSFRRLQRGPGRNSQIAIVKEIARVEEPRQSGRVIAS